MDSTQILADAQKCHKEGRFHAAANLLLAAFRADPENPNIARQLGVVMRAVGDLNGAVDFLSRSFQADPSDPETIAELILALHELGRFEDASAVLLNSLNAGVQAQVFAEALHAA